MTELQGDAIIAALGELQATLELVQFLAHATAYASCWVCGHVLYRSVWHWLSGKELLE